jgi:membrane associated rhomboid family serine protease
MIPVRDSLRTRTFPYVNLAIIAVNILIFLYELTLDPAASVFRPISELDQFFFDWAAVPACLGDLVGVDPPQEQVRRFVFICEQSNHTLVSPFAAMFMHGGWMHLLGNMLFLWIFGDNVEDAMGHARYLVFYLVCGLGASLAHVAATEAFFAGDELIPSVGASGAIAGVMGAYLVLYPRAIVGVLIPMFLIFWPMYVPAVFLIAVWFLLQLLSGVAAIGGDVVGGAGGVAWFAHIGGFVLGLLLVPLLGRRRARLRPVYPEPRPRDWWE